MRDQTFRVGSWNVNGLRACWKKGFATWLNESRAEVLGVQETRAHADQLPKELQQPGDLLERAALPHASFQAAERKGYSGVGLFSGIAPDVVDTALSPEFDREGRLQLARFGELLIANVYFPNGSGQNRDNSRVPFKLAFYRALFERLESARQDGGRVLVIGDFNTAHREIDLARPKDNRKTSGFLEEERAEFSRWLDAGWVDTFRHFHQGGGHYTWWSQRFGVRERNIGWRIDYVLASEGAAQYLTDANIHPHVLGSDHCPISVDLDRAILKS